MNDSNKDVREDTQLNIFLEEKREAIESYSKYLEEGSLNKEDQHKIKEFDRKVDSFEQMQYRLEAIDKVKHEGSNLDLESKEAELCATRGEHNSMNKIIIAEYTRQLTKEEAEKQTKEKKESKQKSMVQQMSM